MHTPHIIKHSKLEPHAELFSAFSFADTLTLELHIPEHLYPQNVKLELWLDDIMENRSFEAAYLKNKNGFAIFAYTFDFSSICENNSGLFYYHFSFDSTGGRAYVSRNGDTLLPEIVFDTNSLSSYQLLIYPEDFTTPDGIKGGVMYQIFVDRFSRGSTRVPVREDAEVNPDWDGGVPQYAEYQGGFVKNNMFFGGTLWGVCEKLDYLTSLGVNVIYLNPIFEAYSNHKYDTGDYMKVDEMFGGEAAFDKLISEADKRGIKVILDGVFNHTGSDSIYFNKNNRYDTVGAYNSPDSPYGDWYYFDSFPDDYKSWWGIEILPKLNGRNSELVRYLCGENGVVRHYLRRGAYGWRLDVADELDGELLEKIRDAAKAERRDSVVIGEVWEDASNKVAYDRRRRYFRGAELDSVMNYPLRGATVEYMKTGDAYPLARISKEIYSHYPKCVSDTLMNFLGTHDTERILSVLGGEDISSMTNAELSRYKMSAESRERAVKLLKLAYVIIATMPGVPCIYYGDEAGSEGARDPFNRLPYPWGRENAELVDWYKKIGEIRRAEKLFEEGYFRVVSADNGVFVYERFDGDEKLTVVVNRSAREAVYKNAGVGKALISGECGENIIIPPDSAEIIRN